MHPCFPSESCPPSSFCAYPRFAQESPLYNLGSNNIVVRGGGSRTIGHDFHFARQWPPAIDLLLHGLTHRRINFVSPHTVFAFALNGHVGCSVFDCTAVEERITHKIDGLLAYRWKTIHSSSCHLGTTLRTVSPTPSGLEVRVRTVLFRHNEVSAWISVHADPIPLRLLVFFHPFSLSILDILNAGILAFMIKTNGKRVANMDRTVGRQLFRHGPRLWLPSCLRPSSSSFQLNFQQQGLHSILCISSLCRSFLHMRLPTRNSTFPHCIFCIFCGKQRRLRHGSESSCFIRGPSGNSS